MYNYPNVKKRESFLIKKAFSVTICIIWRNGVVDIRGVVAHPDFSDFFIILNRFSKKS